MDERLIKIIEEMQQRINKTQAGLSSELESRKLIGSEDTRSGWCYAVNFVWRKDEFSNETTCVFEFDGINLGGSAVFDLQTDVEIDFITKEMIENVIVPEVQVWWDKKIKSEVECGFYQAKATLNITIDIEREKMVKTPDNTGSVWCKHGIIVVDERRLLKQIKALDIFVHQKRYEQEPLEKYRYSLKDISYTPMVEFLDRYGSDHLIKMYEMIDAEMEKESLREALSGELLLGLTSGVYGRIKKATIENRSITPDEEAMLKFAVTYSMRFGSTLGKQRIKHVVYYAQKHGSALADALAENGSGLIDIDFMKLSDEDVDFSANDVTQSVYIAIKNEGDFSYKKVVEMLSELIEKGFPESYDIEFTSGKQKLLSIPQLAEYQKDANNFWVNASNYPSLSAIIQNYVRLVVKKHPESYDGSSGEKLVPAGGWAMFSQGLEGDNGSDIIEYFVNNNSSKNAIGLDYFAEAYIDKFGVNTKNLSVVLTLLSGISGLEFKKVDITDKLTDEVVKLIAFWIQGKYGNKNLGMSGDNFDDIASSLYSLKKNMKIDEYAFSQMKNKATQESAEYYNYIENTFFLNNSPKPYIDFKEDFVKQVKKTVSTQTVVDDKFDIKDQKSNLDLGCKSDSKDFLAAVQNTDNAPSKIQHEVSEILIKEDKQTENPSEKLIVESDSIEDFKEEYQPTTENQAEKTDQVDNRPIQPDVKNNLQISEPVRISSTLPETGLIAPIMSKSEFGEKIEQTVQDLSEKKQTSQTAQIQQILGMISHQEDPRASNFACNVLSKYSVYDKKDVEKNNGKLTLTFSEKVADVWKLEKITIKTDSIMFISSDKAVFKSKTSPELSAFIENNL